MLADPLHPNRLRWLCRRGMLELDAWLTRYLEMGLPAQPAERQADFVRLLERDDMDLFDWLTGEREPPAEFRAVVDAIRTTRYKRT